MKKIKCLLNIADLTKSDFYKILDFSRALKIEKNIILNGKQIGLIFEKNSTRTRLSFQVGINQLGGNYIDINLENLNLSRFESFEDTINIMGCYLDGLIYRTTDHKKLIMAKEYFQKPIINALSNYSHPCQAISDIFTISEHFNRLENLKIVWMGDMNNVLFSIVESCQFLNNVQIFVFTDKKIIESCWDLYSNFKNFHVSSNMDKNILSETDCVMTDVFTSMNDLDNKKEILLNRFQVNSEIMSITKPNAVFMHCLPAKIGSEVTEEVIRSPKSIVFKQAENRLHVQKGILKWLDI